MPDKVSTRYRFSKMIAMARLNMFGVDRSTWLKIGVVWSRAGLPKLEAYMDGARILSIKQQCLTGFAGL